MLSIQHALRLPKLEKPRETQLLAPYLKIVRGAHSVSMGPSAKGKLSCATCLGRDRKSVLLSPPADSLQKWGDVRRGYRSAPRWALLPLPQARQQRGHSSTQGVRRGESEQTDSLRQPGLFSHIHTPGCLKVTCNQTFTGQELPLCYLEI